MADLRFKYDMDRDELVVEGIRYSGEMFRAWAGDNGALPLNQPFQIVKRENGVVTIERLELATREGK